MTLPVFLPVVKWPWYKCENSLGGVLIYGNNKQDGGKEHVSSLPSLFSTPGHSQYTFFF